MVSISYDTRFHYDIKDKVGAFHGCRLELFPGRKHGLSIAVGWRQKCKRDPKKMKIWLPAIEGTSGVDVFTRRLAEALRRRRMEAEITWFPSRYEFAPFLLRHVLPPLRTTVIHGTSWNAFAFKRSGIPLIVTEQLGVQDRRARSFKTLAQHLYHQILIRRFVTASLRAASAITAVSSFTAVGLRDTLQHPNVEIIYNWVDVGKFSPDPSTRSSPQKPFRLLFVGNPIRRKGTDLFAPIMRRLGKDFELRFTSGLRGVAMKEKAPNMICIGRITDERDLINCYRRCDAFLFPSRFEGLPYAVLEAMACGKPVIAAESSSLPELVENRINGILCRPDDVEEFVQACRYLADYPNDLVELGIAARRKAEAQFSEDAVVPRYIELYQKLAHP